MYRLEHRRKTTVGVDVATRGQTDSASDRRGQIGQDVTKQVVGHDDVKARRVGDQEDRRSVDMHVVGDDAGIFAGHRIEDAVPQPSGVDQDVVLVDQGDLVAASGRTLEGVADDSLHSVPSVDAHFRCDLVGGAGPYQPAIAAVQALGALPNDHKVDVLASDHLLGQRGRNAEYSRLGRRLT